MKNLILSSLLFLSLACHAFAQTELNWKTTVTIPYTSVTTTFTNTTAKSTNTDALSSVIITNDTDATIVASLDGVPNDNLVILAGRTLAMDFLMDSRKVSNTIYFRYNNSQPTRGNVYLDWSK